MLVLSRVLREQGVFHLINGATLTINMGYSKGSSSQDRPIRQTLAVNTGHPRGHVLAE